MSPHCGDEVKYGVVDQLIARINQHAKEKHLVAGHAIVATNTVNGIRFTFADGSWGLVRASSNKPELVVVCESMASDQHMRDIFTYVKSLLDQIPAVGAFNQTV